MRVLGDEDAITQVVYNLLDNAIKFSEPGGDLGLSLWKQGSHAYVAVRNQGETISPEELPLIFDRFHKTDRSRSRDRDGVGLGLYIVRAILNQHEEDISVTSRNGVTEFVFTLTLKPENGFLIWPINFIHPAILLPLCVLLRNIGRWIASRLPASLQLAETRLISMLFTRSNLSLC